MEFFNAWYRPWLLTWMGLTLLAYFLFMVGALLVSTELLVLELVGYASLLAALVAGGKALVVAARSTWRELREEFQK